MRFELVLLACLAAATCAQDACQASKGCMKSKMAEITGISEEEMSGMKRDMMRCVGPCMREAMSGSDGPFGGGGGGGPASFFSSGGFQMIQCMMSIGSQMKQCMSDAGFEMPDRMKQMAAMMGGGGPGGGGPPSFPSFGGRGKRSPGGGPGGPGKHLMMIAYMEEVAQAKCPQAAQQMLSCVKEASGGKIFPGAFTPEQIHTGMCDAMAECDPNGECAAYMEAKKEAMCSCGSEVQPPQGCDQLDLPVPPPCEGDMPSPQQICEGPPPTVEQVLEGFGKMGGRGGGPMSRGGGGGPGGRSGGGNGNNGNRFGFGRNGGK